MQGWENGESNVRVASFSSFRKGKMLNRVDLDLNSIQGSTDSLWEGLKHTMLNQELVFTSQVYELHRLYRIQRAMMEDFKQNGFDDYNLHKGGMNLIAVNLNNQVKQSMAEYEHAENFNSQHESRHRLPGFKQKPLDLQLSADEFISHCNNDISGKCVLQTSLKEPIKSKDSSPDEVFFDLDNLKLSLSMGRNVRKDGEYRSWMVRKTCASSSQVIDLENPNFYSKNDEYLGHSSGFSALSTFSRHKGKLESFPESGMKDVSYGSTPNRSITDVGPSCQRRTPCDSGLKENNLDLNIVQLEDFSYCSNNHSMVENPSIISLSAVSPTSSRKTSDICRQKDVNFNSEQQKKDHKFTEDNGQKTSFIDIDSEIETMGSLSKPSNDLSSSMNRSSSIKTMQSSVKCGDLNFSTSDESQNAKVNPRAAHSGDQDRRSSDSTQSNIQFITRSKEPEVNEIVQIAAELLMQMSLESRSKEFKNEEDDGPQCSSDSYEAIVLKAKETSPDDYCISSNAFVVEESEKKDCGYKLKRGTRMKDFQKDILPGLSTLSRHEVREDINIMEGVIRSREYRKMRAKFGDGSDWFRPAKSKRSRVGRR